MSTADKAIAEILKRYGEDFAANTWVVPGGKTRAIQHKCIERMCIEAGITFDPPTMIRAEVDWCAMIVTGHITVNDQKRTEWSVGEAAPKNNKNAYPYSMAEKRGKDRVALKLIGLHGLLYSEEEAEDFRGGQQSESEPDLRRVTDLHTNGKPIVRNASQEACGNLMAALWKVNGPKVDRWMQLDAVKRDIAELDQTDRDRVLALADERRAVQ